MQILEAFLRLDNWSEDIITEKLARFERHPFVVQTLEYCLGIVLLPIEGDQAIVRQFNNASGQLPESRNVTVF